MNKSQVLKRILKNSTFCNMNFDKIMRVYADYQAEWSVSPKPKSKEKKNYIGLEIECFTDLSITDLTTLLIINNLDECVEITDDGSIEPDFGHDIELRCLFPEKKLKSYLKKLAKVFKQGKFGVNDSCGLHVHLDMRNRDVGACYTKLLKFQDILFGLVAPERWTNDYCDHSEKNRNPNNRYVAINKNSYKIHKTIEVRLHHSTLDMKQVEKWVTLLTNIVNSRSPKKVESKEDVLKWAKNKRGIRGYVDKTFNPKWFKEKAKILASGESVEEDYEDYDGDSMW